jgi:hypothetical protein
VYIRKHNPGQNSYTKYGECYIPKQVALETFCYCGFPIGEQQKECSICSSEIYKAIAKTAVCGTLEHVKGFINLKK